MGLPERVMQGRMANIVLYVILGFSLAALVFCLIGFTRALRQDPKNADLYARIPDFQTTIDRDDDRVSVKATPEQATTEENFSETRLRQTKLQ